MKHTPGPWTNSGGTIESIDGWHVASVHGNGGNQLANARLIAAAPEAIALLEEVIEDYDICCESEGWTDRAMALIRRVRGEK